MKKNKHSARYGAGVSLAVMAAGFASTLPFESAGMRILSGAFEAGLVGGCADWFAVTALFRHPFGIPIPHTALLPRNRAKMTNGLIEMLNQQLLAKESIMNKLSGVRLTEWMIGWGRQALSRFIQDERFADRLEQLIRSIPSAKAAPVLAAQIRVMADRLDEAAVARKLLDTAYSYRLDEKILDFIVERAEEWVASPAMQKELGRSVMQIVNGLQLGGIMQFAVNAFLGYLDEDKLGVMIQQAILGKLEGMRSPHNEQRLLLLGQFRSALDKLAAELPHNETFRRLKESLLEPEKLSGQLETLLESLKERLIEQIRKESFPQTAEAWTQRLLQQFEQSAWSHTAENWLKKEIADFALANHDKIGQLVRENMDKLNDREMVELVEDKVGQDLQWIRINGAVCGFLIGLGLQVIRLLTGVL